MKTILLAILGIQICVFFLVKQFIPIPKVIIDEILTKALDFEGDSTINYEAYYLFPNMLYIKNCQVKNKSLFFKSAQMIINLSFSTANKIAIDLNSLELKNWIFEGPFCPRISSPNARIIKLNDNSIFLSTSLNFAEQKSKLRFSGVGEIQHVKNLVKSIIKHQNNTSEANFMEDMFDLNNKNFDVFLNLYNKAEISLTEGNNTYSILEFKNGNLHKDFEIIPSRVKLKSLDGTVNIKGQNLHFKNLIVDHYRYPESISAASETLQANRLHVDHLELNGSLIGSINNLNISNSQEFENAQSFVSFNEKQDSYFSIFTHNHRNDINGQLNINSSNTNFYASINGQKRKILTSGGLLIDISSSSISHSRNNLVIKGTDCSILGAPEGNYKLQGVINDNFSINLSRIHGKLGDTNATGSFSQSWSPNRYRFLLNGHCNPNDIKAWFGEWWTKIWTEFNFSSLTPLGDISVQGIWGSTKNHLTHGTILANNFSYRNFNVTKSKINLRVDENSTLLASDSISHRLGTLKAKLEFPRKKKSQGKKLAFDVQGDFPFNEGKQIFSKNIQKELDDICSELASINANGEVHNNASDTYFDLSFDSDRNFSFSGFNVDGLTGKIALSNNKLICNLPHIILNNQQGKSRANFTITSVHQLKTLEFSLELENVSKNDFLKRLNNSKKIQIEKPQSSALFFSEDKNSRLILRLNAKGPLENKFQLVGSGFIQINDKELGQINLFGNLGNALSRTKIPLPLGVFSFNQLASPFRLEGEKVFFDDMIISGPISVMKLEGNLALETGSLDIISRLKLLNKIPIPILKDLIGAADPISKLLEIKVSGNLLNPKWELLLNPKPF
ncbi:MAG: hypothetical protein VX130_07785 [Verrucomicrobiota bacterium]|nr:hypothetical protein [Verrucomicrobiota bacterium]